MLPPSQSLPRAVIIYCPRCNWLLRAAWLAQELLSTFADDLAEVALRPGPSGHFEILVDDTTVWERKADNGFPDAKTLKKRVRDQIAPGRNLGHLDEQRSPD